MRSTVHRAQHFRALLQGVYNPIFPAKVDSVTGGGGGGEGVDGIRGKRSLDSL